MRKNFGSTCAILAIMVAAAMIYWDSLGLRAGLYDPLGSGTMPRIVASAIIVLSLVALLQTFLARTPVRVSEPEDTSFAPRPWLAVSIFGYLVICVVLLHARLPFGLSSTLFLFVSALSIRRFEKSAILPAAVCAVVVGYGLTYLFGAVFGVDLP
ncbi:tripartite tricarboxylate transporter TctB family protein [Chelatococcus sp. GCM10030263]|uniref:tripartite tricarboxylate transporter TctB family protein n=1 Tax=Chelatococcus sp. GCM10030263 TaxID=3273387 RepID=UPI00360A4A8A